MDTVQARSKPAITKVPWNPVIAVLFLVVLYFLAPQIGAVIVSVLPMGLGWDADRLQVWLTNSVYAQFFYVLVTEVLLIGGLLLFLKRFKTKLSTLGLIRPKIKDFGLGLIAYPVYFLLFAIIVTFVNAFVPAVDINQEQQLGFDNIVGALPLILTFISLVILPPLVEEILVRGFLFTSLRKHLKFVGAAVITSLIFAVAHLSASDSGPLYIAAIDTFILSLVLCYMREKTGSLWPGIILHALKNGVAYVSLFILGTA